MNKKNKAEISQLAFIRSAILREGNGFDILFNLCDIYVFAGLIRIRFDSSKSWSLGS